jgi:hypothetical protein
MEEKPDPPDQKQPPEPPPFDPDPDLITYLERGGKPSEQEIREIAEKV